MNELIDDIYNLLHPQNSKTVEEMFLRLEENLQHIQPQRIWCKKSMREEIIPNSQSRLHRKKKGKFGNQKNALKAGSIIHLVEVRMETEVVMLLSQIVMNINWTGNNLSILCVIGSCKTKSPNPCKILPNLRNAMGKETPTNTCNLSITDSTITASTMPPSESYWRWC